MNFALVLKDTIELIYSSLVFDFPRNIIILDYTNMQLIRTTVLEFHSELFR